MFVRRALAAALLVPLVVLSACTDDDPVPKMPTPTSSSSSAEPTETTETAMPEVETAEEFIRRWAATESKMQRSGETSSYREVSQDCQPCLQLADLVESYYSAGGYVRWPGWEINDVRSYPSGGANAFLVKVLSPPTTYKVSKSSAVQTFPGGPATHVLTLEPSGDSWVVSDKSELQ